MVIKYIVLKAGLVELFLLLLWWHAHNFISESYMCQSQKHIFLTSTYLILE
jgi:hypothetical protein